MGAALGVRFAGIVLVGYFALVFLVWFATEIWKRSLDGGWRAVVLSFATRFLAVLTTAWLVMLVWWPPAQVRPVGHLIQTFRVMRDFPWPGTVRFGGRDILASDLPWDYLPRTALLTLPEFLLVALLIGSVRGVSGSSAATSLPHSSRERSRLGP